MPLSPQPTNADAISARPAASGFRRLGSRLAWLLLVLNTLRHLRARQCVYLVIRRLLPDRYRAPEIAVVPDIAAPIFQVCALTSVPHHCVHDGRLYFLNEPAHFAIDNPDWRSAGRSKLWRYNLHYFEFLSDPALSSAQCRALIDSWIDSNPTGAGDAWEPYPVSLRIISWTRYFDHLLRNGESIDPRWQRSLYLQCDWLYHHMEFHIDANHLFKNIIALFVGAQLFRVNARLNASVNDDKRVSIWLHESTRWMRIALQEQFNSDGGHYERSPMYHLLCLHYCVDAYNALSQSNADRGLRRQLGDVITRGLTFAYALQHSNGRLALFSDSANGIAPDVDALCGYARRVDSDLLIPTTAGYGSSWFSGSGYFCWHDARQHCIVSAQSPTPSYQPGHSHADCLAYEYSLDGVPVIVNAGNTCYEIGEDRRYARSTAAHNTIEIDGLDQSELWGAHRMARRAAVKASAPEHTASGVVFIASHDGYARLGCGIEHQRKIVTVPARVDIEDTISGRGQHRIRQFTHLHPDFSALIQTDHPDVCLVLNRHQRVIARLIFGTSACESTLRIERTPYFDQFGLRQLRDTIVVAAVTALPCTIRCTIAPEPGPDLNVQKIPDYCAETS